MMRVLTLLTIVVITVMGGPATALETHEEDIVFVSEGVRLSGTLVLPQSEPKAAIVLIQGAGPQERLTRFAEVIASRGFVVLTYDKRGVGRSKGVYEGANNVSAANLNLLAEDAAAAVRELGRRPALRKLPTGLLGISQAGWIGPLAATRLGDLDFMGFWGGPVCKVSEQLGFQKVGNPGVGTVRHPDGHDHSAMIASIIAGGDIDPSDSLKRLNIPVMWMFGGADTQVPVALSIERLQALVVEGHREFAHRLYPGEGHPALSDRSVVDMFGWLNTIVKASHPTP